MCVVKKDTMSTFLAHPSKRLNQAFTDQNDCLFLWSSLEYKLFTFTSSSPDPLGKFQLNLPQSILK